MKSRIEILEKGYQQQLDRAQERIRHAQEKEQSLRGSLRKKYKETEEKYCSQIALLEEENRTLKDQSNSHNLVCLSIAANFLNTFHAFLYKM